MANQSTFPTTLDGTPTDRTSGDSVPSSDWNTYMDGVVNLETKVGIDSSAVEESIDYKVNHADGIVHKHASRHQNGGLDEVSVVDLSGLLADDQHVIDAEVLAALGGYTDGSASGYIRIGDLQICWGSATSDTTDNNARCKTFTFPVAFKDGTTPVVAVNSPSGWVAWTDAHIVDGTNPNATTVVARAWKHDGSTPNDATVLSYIAIGVWQ